MRKISKKKTIKFFIILLIIFLIYFLFKMLPDILLNAGKKAYEQKDYVSAYNNLSIAHNLRPRNSSIRYYYIQTLVNLKPTLKVQKEIYKIYDTDLSDTADLISDTQIYTWKDQIFSRIGENYIEQAPMGDKILRWDITKLPLKVYIKNNSATAPDYFIPQIQNAFLKWQKASANLVKFTFTNDEKNSDIFVTINPSKDMKKCTKENCKYSVAYTRPKINANILKKMDISFYDSNNLSQPFSETEIYNTALHEIGHALGIMGHSYNKGDIMYMEAVQENGFENLMPSKPQMQILSQNDMNTLNLLYKLIPNITNTPQEEFDTSHQFFSPIIIGDPEEISIKELLEAQNYINNAPDLPNGYIDLALAFSSAKQYDNALENLNKALTLCSNDQERYLVYYNLSLVYMDINDWQNSLMAAINAEQIDPTSDIEGIIGLINYKMNNKDKAKAYYQVSLEKSPDNIISAYNLATMYIKEFNFVQAGKVLNKLIQANPDAKKDSKIKLYSPIIFLFR